MVGPRHVQGLDHGRPTVLSFSVAPSSFFSPMLTEARAVSIDALYFAQHV